MAWTTAMKVEVTSVWWFRVFNPAATACGEEGEGDLIRVPDVI